MKSFSIKHDIIKTYLIFYTDFTILLNILGLIPLPDCQFCSKPRPYIHSNLQFWLDFPIWLARQAFLRIYGDFCMPNLIPLVFSGFCSTHTRVSLLPCFTLLMFYSVHLLPICSLPVLLTCLSLLSYFAIPSFPPNTGTFTYRVYTKIDTFINNSRL